jgi:membrane associated rhomboid family serine protease
MVRNLLIINIGLYFISSLLRLDINEIGSLRNVNGDYFQPYQYFTYMFLHGGTLHLLSNMFALFMFGPLLEQFWGPKRFLIFYIITGVGAGVLYSGIEFYETKTFSNAVEQYYEQPSPGKFKQILEKKAGIPVKQNAELNSFIYEFNENPTDPSMIEESKAFLHSVQVQQSNSRMVGASGAIFGILLAFGMLFPNTVLMLLFPPIPIKAKYFVAIYGLFEFFSGIQRSPGDNVAHFAHLSGMLVAFILIKIWNSDRKKFY